MMKKTFSMVLVFAILAVMAVGVVPACAQAEENVFQFEAENTYVNEIVGGNFSSNPTGRNCVVKDDRDMGASNGYYVGSLCNNGATVEFELYTTEDIEGATLIVSLSSNTVDFVLDSSATADQYYVIAVNGEPLDYGTIPVSAYGEFTEFAIEGITLKADVEYNSIMFYTANSYSPTSGIFAAAPAIDYIQIVTDSDAEVTMELYEGNY
ncbi:MAG: hypothetical protein IJ083_05830 [Clostridia bacterium]|nr:hypothetical protein [Clostridia bacterium]